MKHMTNFTLDRTEKKNEAVTQVVVVNILKARYGLTY